MAAVLDIRTSKTEFLDEDFFITLTSYPVAVHPSATNVTGITTEVAHEYPHMPQVLPRY